MASRIQEDLTLIEGLLEAAGLAVVAPVEATTPDRRSVVRWAGTDGRRLSYLVELVSREHANVVEDAVAAWNVIAEDPIFTPVSMVNVYGMPTQAPGSPPSYVCDVELLGSRIDSRGIADA